MFDDSLNTYNLSVFPFIIGSATTLCAAKYDYRIAPKCRYPGLLVEILRLIESKAHLPLKFTNDSVKSDVASTCTVVTPARLKQGMRFGTEPIRGLDLGVLSADRKFFATIFGNSVNFGNVFEPEAWVIILTATALYQLFSSLRNGLILKHHFRDRDGAARFISPLSLTLLTVFSFELYKGGLLAELVIDKSVPLFGNTAELAQLINNGQVKPMMIKSYVFFQTLTRYGNESSESSSIVLALRDALRNNPPIDFESFRLDYNRLGKEVMNHRVIIADTEQLELIRGHVCGTHVTALPDLSAAMRWPCNFQFSNSTPQSVINRIDFVLRQYRHVLTTFRDRYNRWIMSQNSFCPDHGEHGTGRHGRFTLDFIDCSLIFALLVGGFSVSLVVLFIEQIFCTIISKLKAYTGAAEQ